MNFYVYAHIRLDSGVIFYVGKGTGRRAKIKGRNTHWKNIVNKTKYRIEYLENNLTEKEAFKKEREWITYLKSIDQCVANYSLGGEGCSGYKWTPEQRARHSIVLSKRNDSMRLGQIERINKIKGRTKETHSGVRIISEKNSGKLNGRAIYRVHTPRGEFDTIKGAANHFKCSSAAIHKWINNLKKENWYKTTETKESK